MAEKSYVLFVPPKQLEKHVQQVYSRVVTDEMALAQATAARAWLLCEFLQRDLQDLYGLPFEEPKLRKARRLIFDTYREYSSEKKNGTRVRDSELKPVLDALRQYLEEATKANPVFARIQEKVGEQELWLSYQQHKINQVTAEKNAYDRLIAEVRAAVGIASQE